MTRVLQEDVSPKGYHPMAFALFMMNEPSRLETSLLSLKRTLAKIQILEYNMAEIIIASHMKRYSLPEKA